MTTRNFYRFSKGMTEEERRDAAMETIRRRALNNQSVLRRKLKAASYGAARAAAAIRDQSRDQSF